MKKGHPCYIYNLRCVILYISEIVNMDSIPAKFCSDPFGKHKKKIHKELRHVQDNIISKWPTLCLLIRHTAKLSRITVHIDHL